MFHIINSIINNPSLSLQFFLDMFESVVKSNPNLNNVTGATERLKIITTDLFTVAYTRIG
jgi:hypothetical protein